MAEPEPAPAVEAEPEPEAVAQLEPEPAPAVAEPEPEGRLARGSSAAEQTMWMALQADGTWLPLPPANSAALDEKWLSLRDVDASDVDAKDMGGRAAGTASAAAARVPLPVAQELLGEVLADAKDVRRVLKWADTADDGMRWHGDAPYTDADTVEPPLAPTQLQDLCVRNGVFAAPTEAVERMLARLASLHLLAGNRRIRPASLLDDAGTPREDKFPQDTRDTEVGFCSWCRRVTLFERVQKNLTSRDLYVCQSCAQQTHQCKACKAAKIEPCGMACARGAFDDNDCFVHTYLSAAEAGSAERGALPEDAVPKSMVHQPVAVCPWCDVECPQVIDQVNKARRSTYKCSGCKQRTLPCKGCKGKKRRSAGGSDADRLQALAPVQAELAPVDVPESVVVEAQKLRMDAAKAVAAADAEHGEMLQVLRECAGMASDASWVTLGFQNDDPCTDFRSTGFLGLLATVHFTQSNPEAVKEVYTAAAGGDAPAESAPGASPFPFALVSINACAALVNLLEIDEPVPDSPLLVHAIKFGAEGQSLEHAFFELHSAMVLKLQRTWKDRALSPVDFGPAMEQVCASLTAFLTAPVGFSSRRSLVAPAGSSGDEVGSSGSAEALRGWATSVEEDAVAVQLPPPLPARPSEAVTPLDAHWDSPLAELQAQKYRLLHRFTNRTAHTLSLVGEHTESGTWWQAPPPKVEPGATIAWGSCGKPGVFGVSSGTAGAVLYHTDTFDVALEFTRSTGPLGVDKAAGSVNPPGLLAANALNNVYDALHRTGTHRHEDKGVVLSCADPADCEYGLKHVEWTLVDSGSADGEDGDGEIVFCRGHPLWDDDYCFDCAGVKPEDRELRFLEDAGTPARFCSWCFDYSPLFTLKQKNTAGRNEWECGTCGGTCYTCKVSGCPHLARGGVSNMAGFARMRCDRCRLGSQPCADIAAKMASMDAHFQTLCESTDAMRAELTKETPQLKNAVESGMLRPFICLVAMGWRQRRSLAMQLGWSLAESEVFGDPHGEAWEILSKGNSGVQDRASQSYEKAAGMDADWDEVLNRVSNSAFGCSRYVKSTDVADPAGKTSRPIKERERQYEERSARLRNPLDPRIRSLEDEVMEKLWCSRMGDVAPSERDEMEALLREPQSQELWTRLRQECGIANGFAACYFLYSLLEAERTGAREAGGGATTEEKSRRQEFLDTHCRDSTGDVGRATPLAERGLTKQAVLMDDSSAGGVPQGSMTPRDGLPDMHAAVKEKEDVTQEREAEQMEMQSAAKTGTTRAGAVAVQATVQVTMRATGNAAIAPILGSGGAAVATGAMLGIGIALVVKDLVKVCFGSSEGRLISTVRAVVCTRYALALRGIMLEELYPLEDDAVE